MRILVVAPDEDDETLAIGGTIAGMVSEGHHVTVALMTGYSGARPTPVLLPEAFLKVRPEFRPAREVLGVEDVIMRRAPWFPDRRQRS